MTSTSGGEAIVNGLVAHGVDTVFGLPGAQIYGLFDAFHQAQLKVIGARHEQACGYMAYGYARSTGKPGVFSVVPGPGVLNAGAASGYSIRSAHLTKVRKVASWSGISCRCPRPLPMNAVGTCPVRHSTGSFDPNAVSNAAPALSTPGPGTTLNTPGLPVDRA